MIIRCDCGLEELISIWCWGFWSIIVGWQLRVSMFEIFCLVVFLLIFCKHCSREQFIMIWNDQLRERCLQSWETKTTENLQNSSAEFWNRIRGRFAEISFSCHFFVSRWILPGVGLRSSMIFLFWFLFLVFQYYRPVAYPLQSLVCIQLHWKK